MNHSLYSADGRTHLRIIVVGLACAILVAAIGIFARLSVADASAMSVVRAGHPTALSGGLRTIR